MDKVEALHIAISVLKVNKEKAKEYAATASPGKVEFWKNNINKKTEAIAVLWEMLREEDQ